MQISMLSWDPQMESTEIKAKAANRQSMDIRGVSKGMYIQFPNITRTFLVKPLVVQNLPCDINLGAQFNFVMGLTPQKVVYDQEGRKKNVSKLGRTEIQLQFQDASNETLRNTIEDPEFLWWLEREPAQQRRGVD